MYCGAGPLAKRGLHIDCVDPAASADDLCNLAVACTTCFNIKAGRSVVEFVREQLPATQRQLAILQALASRFT